MASFRLRPSGLLTLNRLPFFLGGVGRGVEGGSLRIPFQPRLGPLQVLQLGPDGPTAA